MTTPVCVSVIVLREEVEQSRVSQPDRKGIPATTVPVEVLPGHFRPKASVFVQTQRVGVGCAAGSLVIENGQRRIGGAQADADRVRELQVDHLVPVDHTIVEDRYREHLGSGLTIAPGQRAGHSLVVHAIDSRSVECGISDRCHTRGAAAPHHRDHGLTSALGNRIGGRVEADRTRGVGDDIDSVFEPHTTHCHRPLWRGDRGRPLIADLDIECLAVRGHE